MKGLRLFVFVLLSVFFFSSTGKAQLCTGSLGDPVVNITFGSGSNPGPALAPGITNYGYLATSCPGDGFYNIGTSTTACFGDTWHTITEDHTVNDNNGYMMIVNASNNPGVFYVDTVKGLCGGTTYEFAAWIMNVIKSTSCNGNTIQPNVTFNIETLTGTVLVFSNTGNIAPGTPQWNQYGAFFVTPANETAVVIRMTNNSTGGCGNDLLLDDITFRPCGPKALSSVTGGNDIKNICVGQPETVNMSVNVSPVDANTRYQWQTSSDNGASYTNVQGATTNTLTVFIGATTAGVRLYRCAVGQGNNVNVTSCRVLSNIITVRVNSLPVPLITSNSPRCIGDTLRLSATGAATYTWAGPAGYSASSANVSIFRVTAANGGKYVVRATSVEGCVKSDSIIVAINTSVVANAGADVNICIGAGTTLRGASGSTYAWSPASGLSSVNTANTIASPNSTTTYTLAVSNGQCVAYDSVKVTVLPRPTVNAGPDRRILQGQSVVLNAAATGTNLLFVWMPFVFISNPALLQPTVSPVSDITYTITATSTNGCGVATDNVFVRVFKAIVVPNTFSPNGDGINDLWNIIALDTYPEAVLSVFDRYGRLVYTAMGDTPPWNGAINAKPLPVGTYYYLIELKNGLDPLKGNITILR